MFLFWGFTFKCMNFLTPNLHDIFFNIHLTPVKSIMGFEMDST